MHVGCGQGVLLVGQVFAHHVAVGMLLVPQTQRGPQIQLTLARDLFIHMDHETVAHTDILTVPMRADRPHTFEDMA